jgi:AraC-like DNA-binding protein
MRRCGDACRILREHIRRACVAEHGASAAGWIGVLSDQRIGGALTLMHGDVGHRWIVGELASGVAMSRSAFALRFKATVGVSLSEYLRRWRMQLAERARRRKSSSVASLASALGYASESAFGNAYKRAFGRSPRRYRAID